MKEVSVSEAFNTKAYKVFFIFYTVIIAGLIFGYIWLFIEPFPPKFSIFQIYMIIGWITIYYGAVLKWFSARPAKAYPKYYILGIFIFSVLAGVAGVTMLWHLANVDKGIFPKVEFADVIGAIMAFSANILFAIYSGYKLLSGFTFLPKDKKASESKIIDEKAKEPEGE